MGSGDTRRRALPESPAIDFAPRTTLFAAPPRAPAIGSTRFPLIFERMLGTVPELVHRTRVAVAALQVGRRRLRSPTLPLLLRPFPVVRHRLRELADVPSRRRPSSRIVRKDLL